MRARPSSALGPRAHAPAVGDGAGERRRAAPAPPRVAGRAAGYVIGADDVLSIVFWRDKDMSADVVGAAGRQDLAAAAERRRRPPD